MKAEAERDTYMRDKYSKRLEQMERLRREHQKEVAKLERQRNQMFDQIKGTQSSTAGGAKPLSLLDYSAIIRCEAGTKVIRLKIDLKSLEEKRCNLLANGEKPRGAETI